MRADCHIHMVLDGVYYRDAIDTHRAAPDERLIRARLEEYRDAGITFLRDGGDAWNVGATAALIAREYGIDYRTPVFPIHKKGRYGGFIGKGYETLAEYAALVMEARTHGADFIKVMISGIMDFDHYGTITGEPYTKEEIREVIRVAHEEGMAVMAHANGAACVRTAAENGVDSVEHGAYLDEEAVSALAESKAVWVPTLCTIVNLIGSGRYPDEVLCPLAEKHRENIVHFASLGGSLACGSDAGAYLVKHVEGCADEERLLSELLGEDTGRILEKGTNRIRERFTYNG